MDDAYESLGEPLSRELLDAPAPDPVFAQPCVTEPFIAGRAASRVMFDFGVMASLFKPEMTGAPLLDFAAGSGWLTEFCARMGMRVVAFDIHGDMGNCLSYRARADCRIDRTRLRFAHGDGHAMPFPADSFGHALCYDAFHHLHDYPKALSEFFRVLKPGGRAIFVEPGARHSKSPDTIAFLEAQKKHDPSWIERDVILEEVDDLARAAGFSKGVNVVPAPHPLALQTYSLQEWAAFRGKNGAERLRYTDVLAQLNYWDRIIFFLDKP